MEGTQDENVDGHAVNPPMDVVVRIWTDRQPEVIAPGVSDWLVRAALGEVLDSYVEYELTPAGEEEE